tara:strand:- start:176 stop:331 length:156 start_codon:yes stop_codon:yes gene_type:complete
MDDNIKKDEEFVIKAIMPSSSVLNYADKALRTNKDFTLKVLNLCKTVFEYI